MSIPMKNIDHFYPGAFYHIYNRAVGAEKLFLDNFEYDEFIFKWQKYVAPFTETYAYCLMPNHFHALIRIKHIHEIPDRLEIKEVNLQQAAVQLFSNFFNSYCKSFNHRHCRKGKLFMLPFKRKQVTSDNYFTQLVYYIHRNPLHHGIQLDPVNWSFSSYGDIIHNHPTWIHRHAVLEWFDGREKFIEYHKYMNILDNGQT